MPVIHTNTRQEKTIANLKKAIAIQIPDMMRGFTITTLQGEINIDPEFAEPFRNLAFEVLQYQLNQAQAANEEVISR